MHGGLVTVKDDSIITINFNHPIIPFNQYSSYVKLKLTVAWMFHFIKACRTRMDKRNDGRIVSTYPATEEMKLAENYLLSVSQNSALSNGN